jgi:hypothetical protein
MINLIKLSKTKLKNEATSKHWQEHIRYNPARRGKLGRQSRRRAKVEIKVLATLYQNLLKEESGILLTLSFQNYPRP